MTERHALFINAKFDPSKFPYVCVGSRPMETWDDEDEDGGGAR